MKFSIAQLCALTLVAVGTVDADFHFNLNSIISGAKNAAEVTDGGVNSYIRTGKGSKSTSNSSKSSKSSKSSSGKSSKSSNDFDSFNRVGSKSTSNSSKSSKSSNSSKSSKSSNDFDSFNAVQWLWRFHREQFSSS